MIYCVIYYIILYHHHWTTRYFKQGWIYPVYTKNPWGLWFHCSSVDIFFVVVVANVCFYIVHIYLAVMLVIFKLLKRIELQSHANLFNSLVSLIFFFFSYFFLRASSCVYFNCWLSLLVKVANVLIWILQRYLITFS